MATLEFRDLVRWLRRRSNGSFHKRVLRPFLSYSSADRDFVEQIAQRLVSHGLAPIFDHWWLRSIGAGYVDDSLAEVKMGVNHADAFVFFGSDAARQSMFAKYECDWAMWRTCSDAPHLPMVYVFLDDRDVRVPHCFRTTVDATPEATDPVSITSDLMDALGIDADRRAARPVRACRRLAQTMDLPGLRAELYNPTDSVRREAAILLACLDAGLGMPSLSVVVRELERGLDTDEAERVVLALGKLQANAIQAIDSVARFVEGDADPYTRARAIRVLGRMGPCSEVVAVLSRLASRGRVVRAAAVTELGQMGSRARAAVPALVELSTTTDPHLRLVVLSALGSIGYCSCEVLIVVLKALAETERQGLSPSQLHSNAMSILNRLAPRAVDVAPALLSAWRESPHFAEWFRGQFPGTDAVIRGGETADRVEQELVTAARQVLRGCELAGAPRPF